MGSKKYKKAIEMQEIAQKFGFNTYKELKNDFDKRKWDILHDLSSDECNENYKYSSSSLKKCLKIMDKAYKEKALIYVNDKHKDSKLVHILNLHSDMINLSPSSSVLQYTEIKCENEKRKNKNFNSEECKIGAKEAYNIDKSQELEEKKELEKRGIMGFMYKGNVWVGTKIIGLD